MEKLFRIHIGPNVKRSMPSPSGRGYESGRGALYDPLSPTLSLRERGLIGRMADPSGFQP
jgi:hypothetical protein